MFLDPPCVSPSRPSLGSFWPAAALFCAALAGTATLVTVTLLGPISLGSMRLSWLLVFMGLLVGAAAWWAGYLWLLRRLAGWSPAQGLQRSSLLLATLCLSIPPALAPFLTGKLPYTLLWDASTQSLYLWLAASLLAAMAIGQELVLIDATRPGGMRLLVAEIGKSPSTLPGRLASSPRAFLRLARNHPLLLLVVAAGAAMRVADLESYHGGDMGVMLSVTFASLQWPPFGYYHAYRPQPWIYNHFPLFPFLLGPTYWVFENLLHWPTFWAAKLQAGLGDLLVAALIYAGAQGRWRKEWGAALAAAWFLAPWVITADDHAMGLAAAFTVAAVATLQCGWLAGTMLALGLATRNEVAFFVAPLALYFLSQRRLADNVAFFGAFVTILALIVGPFILTDPEAIDYALRKHTENIGATDVSSLLTMLQPYLDTGIAALLRQKQEIVAFSFNFLLALIALRDPRPERVLIVVAAGYILTLPVIHQRYIVFLCSLGLLYAARHRDPLIAALILIATWPGMMYSHQALLLLMAVPALLGLLRIGKPSVTV